MWLGGLIALAAAGAPQPPATSPQARYDAAQAAFDKADWQAAVDGFAPLLPSATGKPLGQSGAVIALRLGTALSQLGRYDDALAVTRRGLAALVPDKLSERAEGWRVVGEVERHALHFDAAIDAYGKSYDLSTQGNDGTGRTLAAMGMGYAGITTDPDRIAVVLDALLGDKALVASLDKGLRARLQDMRALAALNAGRLAEATTWIDRALASSGGSASTTVNLRQVDIRGDAAIIAFRRNSLDSMREYLTYTGAGHLKSIDWIGHHVGDLPVCGSEGDLRPDDVAIIQFALAPDGGVIGAVPIYAGRTGSIGATFMRSLAGWKWNPTDLKDVHPFWRAGVRLEMRCDTRPNPEALSAPFAAATAAWLKTKGVDFAPEAKTFVAADDPRLAVDMPASLPLMFRRLGSAKDISALLPRVSRLLDTGGAPPDAYALTAFYAANGASNRSTSGPRAAAHLRAIELSTNVPGLAARFPDAAATLWLKLEWAIALETSGDFAGAQPLLRAVLAAPVAVIDQDNPLRKVATLHLAVVRTRLGDVAGAEQTLATSGISAEQCSMVDTRPVPLNLSIVSSQFPTEALRWHFEGYVQVAYDIDGDGRVANVRTVLAYPPFVFGPATEAAARGFRYAAPTIAGRPIGCEGETQTVTYRIPK